MANLEKFKQLKLLRGKAKFKTNSSLKQLAC